MIKRILNAIRWSSKTDSSTRDILLDIPRYPPFEAGIPIVPIADLINSQSELLKQIRFAAVMTPETFDRLALKAVENYARFVHLLPASRSEHHRGAGGLFRYGLEVAFWALQASSGSIYGAHLSADKRRLAEKRWRYAVFLAGLYHGAGIAVRNVTVREQEGEKPWQPFTCDLIDWATKHDVSRYFVTWRNVCETNTNWYTPLLIGRLIPDDGINYLAEGGEEIIPSMMATLCGINQESDILNKLVMDAREASIEKDLGSVISRQIESTVGLPVHKHIIDSIRRLIKSDWQQVNRVGAKVWVTNNGVLIVWATAVPDILSVMDGDGLKGVPKDSDTLAEIMIDHDFAEPYIDDKGNRSLYWQMTVNVPRIGSMSLDVLKLKNGDLIFPALSPVPIEVSFSGDMSKKRDHQPVVNDKPINENDKSDEEKNVGTSAQDVTRKSTVTKNVAPAEDAKEGKSADSAKRDLKTRDKIRGETEPKESLSKTDRSFIPPGAAGQIIKHIAKDLATKQFNEGEIEVLDNRLSIRFPGNLDKYGFEPSRLVQTLQHAGILVNVPGKPLQFIHSSDDKNFNYILFTEAAYRLISEIVARFSSSEIQRH